MLGSSSAAFPKVLAGKWIRSRADKAGTSPWMWHASLLSSDSPQFPNSGLYCAFKRGQILTYTILTKMSRANQFSDPHIGLAMGSAQMLSDYSEHQLLIILQGSKCLGSSASLDLNMPFVHIHFIVLTYICECL